MNYVTFTQLMLNFSIVMSCACGLFLLVGKNDAKELFTNIWKMRLNSSYYITTIRGYDVYMGIVDLVVYSITLYGLAIVHTQWCWAWMVIDAGLMGLPFTAKQMIKLIKVQE